MFISHDQLCLYHMINYVYITWSNFLSQIIASFFRCLHSSLLVTQDWCITCCYTSVLIALPHLPLETVMICQSKLLVAEEVKFLGHGPWAEMYVCMYIIHLSVYLMFVLTKLWWKTCYLTDFVWIHNHVTLGHSIPQVFSVEGCSNNCVKLNNS